MAASALKKASNAASPSSTTVFRDAELVAAAMAFAVAARLRPATLAVLVCFVLAALIYGARSRFRDSRSAAFGKLAIVCLLVLVVGARSSSRLRDLSVDSGPISFRATLRTDPISANGASSVIADVGGDRYRFLARGLPGAAIRGLQAGDVMEGRGSIRLVSKRSWRVAKHLVADVDVRSIDRTAKGTLLVRSTNGLRDALLASADHFAPTDRALFAGFVLGDARDQPVWVTDEFRAAGLTHLLVVSGQNVAFVLAVLQPVLVRLRRRWRFVATLAVLALFAMVTRFEPSVQRAGVMAALSCGALSVGRPQGTLRILAVTVCVLLIFDPLLAWSVGFGLSVGACAGLAIVTPRLVPFLRGPKFLREPLATTIGAQVGASVVMVPIFGGLPVVSVLANLLALPAAEPIMSWGIAVGLPAGFAGRFIGDWPARLAHVPTQLCLNWVRFVARTCAQIPLGTISMMHVGFAAMLATAWRLRVRRSARVMICVLGLLVPASIDWFTAPRSSGAGIAVADAATGLGADGRVVRRLDVLVVDHGAYVFDVLEGLRRERIRTIDLVVIRSGGRPQRDLVRAIRARHTIGAVLVANRSFAGSVRPVLVANPGMVVQAGRSVVEVESVDGGRLNLRFAAAGLG